ncbi:hypothetical protein SB4_03505 [Sphingomonas sanguinis]|uniref:DUF2971 domain-containing protein n=2 Tax=Sphingomonas sanguinis TaxID=33051 RepID=A0A147J217_9SPHN|nr:hypothetical protein SB4_03505 [Sphingomonas sanguinis]
MPVFTLTAGMAGVQMADLTPEEIWTTFLPNAAKQALRLRLANTRFAHYTSAQSGMKILGSGKMLLRNSTMMNDFSEVQHGMNCLTRCYGGPVGERLKAVMNAVQDGLPEILESNFDAQLLDVRSETYLISISEHGDPEHGDALEDSFGRLSMWRAYAAKNGIAFIFNNPPFLTESNALNAFTSPVVYATPETFVPYFEELVAGVERIAGFLVTQGGKYLHDNLMNTLRFMIQSTKHPSFREEREWRIIYTPTLLQREGALTEAQMMKVPTEIITLGGVPQRVYAIPFKDHPEEGFVGAEIPALLDRVLGLRLNQSQNASAVAMATPERKLTASLS